MQTVHGIRFLPVARVRGTLLGLDARWLGTRGLMLSLLLVLFTPGGLLNHATDQPVWVRIGVGLSSLLAVALTSLGHEFGHAAAGWLAGLPVRAIVLAPEGAVTIRETSDQPHVNFRTALAGPLANALLGTACLGLATVFGSDAFVGIFLGQVGGLQLLTGIANLLPVGRMDGSNILSSWRACRALA
jgi:Zn-dependent protease